MAMEYDDIYDGVESKAEELAINTVVSNFIETHAIEYPVISINKEHTGYSIVNNVEELTTVISEMYNNERDEYLFTKATDVQNFLKHVDEYDANLDDLMFNISPSEDSKFPNVNDLSVIATLKYNNIEIMENLLNYHNPELDSDEKPNLDGYTNKEIAAVTSIERALDGFIEQPNLEDKHLYALVSQDGIISAFQANADELFTVLTYRHDGDTEYKMDAGKLIQINSTSTDPQTIIENYNNKNWNDNPIPHAVEVQTRKILVDVERGDTLNKLFTSGVAAFDQTMEDINNSLSVSHKNTFKPS